MFYSSLQAAISHSIYSNVNLKVKQVICLEAIYHGRDVVAVLPTGYGKSVIFHLLPSLFLDKINYEREAAAHPVVIVVSPLNSRSLSIDKILTKPPIPSLDKLSSPRFWETRDQTLPGSLLARPRR